MPDPGALGTLIIGLESIRLADERPTVRHPTTRRKRAVRQPAVRPAIAGWLRLLADRLDRPIAGGVSG